MPSNALPVAERAGAQGKKSRQLKPEIAARLAERNRARLVVELYQKSVTELSPDELSLMKADFFRNR
jgi:hypothetical protein